MKRAPLPPISYTTPVAAWWRTAFMTWCWGRIIGGALRGGMPLCKYVFNRLLTGFENMFLRVKQSEYHTGYRAFSRNVLTEGKQAVKMNRFSCHRFRSSQVRLALSLLA